MKLRDLQSVVESSTFRTSPSFEVLDGAEHLADDPDIAAVLAPTAGSGASPKAVDESAAALLKQLGEPGRLEEDAVRSPGAVTALVLDGILEILVDGTFVSGPAAASCFVEGTDAGAREGRIAQLSRQALEQLEVLGIADAGLMATHLYRYNTMPESPRAFETCRKEGPAQFLGFEQGPMARLLREHWVGVPPDVSSTVWYSWQPRNPTPPPRFKLYVSPILEALPDAFPAMVSALGEGPAPFFKLGGNVFGLLRPDKLVVYFETLDLLDAAADKIAAALAGLPAQGVPFSAEITADGMLMFGVPAGYGS